MTDTETAVAAGALPAGGLASKEEERPVEEPTTSLLQQELPAHYSVRQQLCDLLSEASAVRCGTALPMEITDKIADYCLYCDFSELPSELFCEGEYEIIQGLREDDYQGSIRTDPTSRDHLEAPLRRDQVAAIERLTRITIVPSVLIKWVHVGFPVGWKGSGELMEFDLWVWLGWVFVFESGCTEVLLRGRPTEFCRSVQNPHRAVELANLSANVMLNLVQQSILLARPLLEHSILLQYDTATVDN